MTKEEKTDIRVGVTVLVGLALLLGGIVWAKSWTVGGKIETARAIFPSAGGLEPGDPVTINGVKSGTVQSIQLEQADVIVTMNFTKHVDLRKDASASISMLELMSGKKVELALGRSSEPLPPLALIPGNYTGDISSLVGTVTVLANTLETITGRTDTLFTFLNKMLKDDFAGKLNQTVDQARSALVSLGNVADNANNMIVEDAPAFKRTLAQAETATNELSLALSENRPGIRMFIDSGARALTEGRAMLQKANTLVSRFDSLISGNSEQKTVFYKLMKDPAFALRVDSVVTSLTKLVEQIRFQGIDANIRFWESSKPIK